MVCRLIIPQILLLQTNTAVPFSRAGAPNRLFFMVHLCRGTAIKSQAEDLPSILLIEYRKINNNKKGNIKICRPYLSVVH